MINFYIGLGVTAVVLPLFIAWLVFKPHSHDEIGILLKIRWLNSLYRVCGYSGIGPFQTSPTKEPDFDTAMKTFSLPNMEHVSIPVEELLKHFGTPDKKSCTYRQDKDWGGCRVHKIDVWIYSFPFKREMTFYAYDGYENFCYCSEGLIVSNENKVWNVWG